MNNLNRILIKHRICPSYKGYKYLLDLLLIEKPLNEVSITTVYRNIGEKYKVTWFSVEKDIRQIIKYSDLFNYSNKKACALLQLELMEVNE